MKKAGIKIRVQKRAKRLAMKILYYLRLYMLGSITKGFDQKSAIRFYKRLAHFKQNVWKKLKNSELRLKPQFFDALELLQKDEVKLFGHLNYSLNSTVTDTKEIDIKIGWEAARLHQFVAAGYLSKFSDKKIRRCCTILTSLWISKFLDRHKICLSSPEANAMEIAIRSINLIWVLTVSEKIHFKIVEEIFKYLQKAKEFIHHFWEDYTYPNNHLIADALGYFYITNFLCSRTEALESLKIFTKIAKDQVIKQGLFYEQSTAYSSLSFEMIEHAMLLKKIFKFELHEFDELYKNTSQAFTNLPKYIKIGDDDSGMIAPLNFCSSEKKIIENGYIISNHEEAGFIILQTQSFAFSFKTKYCIEGQPSGHAHQDLFSITLQVENQNVLINPGSYSYNHSTCLRNSFRKDLMQNNFWSDEICTKECLEERFLMKCNHFDEYKFQQKISKSYDEIRFSFYAQARGFVNISRSVTLSVCNKTFKLQEILIEDQIDPELTDWSFSFLLSPSLLVSGHDNLYSLDFPDKKTKATFYSDIEWKLSKTTYSPMYLASMETSFLSAYIETVEEACCYNNITIDQDFSQDQISSFFRFSYKSE